MVSDSVMYSSEEAAVALGVSRETIRKHVEQGILPARKVGLRGIIRIDEHDLRQYACQYQYQFAPKRD